ncbi:MAG TPA: chorismate-binding protein, partial [Polyangia bacterium]
MIVVACPPIPIAQVARALGARNRPCWLCLPEGESDPLAARAFEVLASDPMEVVEGRDPAALTEAWTRAQSAWAAAGRARVPVGIGQLSYDLARDWHGLAPRASGPWAPIEFRFYDALWVQGAGAPEIWAVDAAAAERLRTRVMDGDPAEALAFSLSPLTAIEPPAQHEAAVARILAYLRAGDVYQVNLARRLRARLQAAGPAGLGLFLALRTHAPAPHALWLGDPEKQRALIGNSPERFLQLSTDGWLETAPIKGTRPRGDTPEEDAAAAADLLATAKDRAEHVMIVDLERNDLGRVCTTGTVHVADLLRLMKLPSVFHLVSRVRGQLRAD